MEAVPDVPLNLRNRVLGRIQQLKYHDIWYHARIRSILALTPEQKRTRGIKRTVRLLSNFPGLWQRTIEQTPGGSCQFGTTLFVAEGAADHYVILNSIRYPVGSQFLPDIALPDPTRVWGLHMEPQDYVHLLGYDDPSEHALTSRFYTNCSSLLVKKGVYRPAPPYVHFHVGKSWDFLSSAQRTEKKTQLGIISSGLSTIEGHRARLEFLSELDASDIDCVIWGRGDNLRSLRKYRGFAPSKWDVHAQCRYSIVIENSVSQLYWSEKPVDALLAWSMPIYHGTPALAQYLPSNSFVSFDLAGAERIDRIRQIILSDPYPDALEGIADARRTILNYQNLYAFLDRELDAL